MATSNSLAIQQLYVAYFNRPADPAGLLYWEGVVSRLKGDTTEVSKAFSASTEYKDLYAGLNPTATVGQVYENLFGRSADSAGLKYWADLYTSGKLSIDQIVTAISDGARGSDAEIVENRGKAAIAFTEALDTPLEQANYNKTSGIELGRAFLDKITDDASLAAAITPDALKAVTAPLGVEPVSQFALTTGDDNLVGTAGADQFNAEFAGIKADGSDATTLGANDVIDGGAGEDTLTIHVGEGFNEILRGTIKNVETINIDNDGGILGRAAGFINAAKFVGAKEIWQMYDAVKITNLGAATTAGFKSIIDKTLEVDAAGASAKIALQTVKGNDSNVVALDVGGSALNAVVIDGTIARTDTSTDAPANSTTLHVTTGQDSKGAALPTLTVNTIFDTILTVDSRAETGTLAKVDASASTGKITYEAASTISSIVGGSNNDLLVLSTEISTTAKAVAIDGGAGNDLLTVNATNAADIKGATVSAKGGAGDDVIVVNVVDGEENKVVITVDGGAGNDVVHLQDGAGGYRFLTANDKLSGGEGVDTLVLATAEVTISDAEYTKLNAVSFERVKFDNAVTDVDASKFAKLTQIEFTHEAAITKLAASQTVFANADVTVATTSYKADAAGTTGNDTAAIASVTVLNDATVDVYAKAIKLTVDAATTGADVHAAVTGDIDNATITLTSDGVDKVASATIVAADAGAGFISVTATGTGSLVIDNTDGALKTINTSGLGGISTKAPIDGLTFIGNGAVAETITLGSGIDHLTLSSYAGVGAKDIDTVTGLKLAATAGDEFKLDLTGLETSATEFTVIKLGTTTGGITAVLDQVAALDDNAVVFTYANNTYIYVENEAGEAEGYDATDFVVKLTGTSYNMDNLATLATLSLDTPI